MGTNIKLHYHKIDFQKIYLTSAKTGRKILSGYYTYRYQVTWDCNMMADYCWNFQWIVLHTHIKEIS